MVSSIIGKKRQASLNSILHKTKRPCSSTNGITKSNFDLDTSSTTAEPAPIMTLPSFMDRFDYFLKKRPFMEAVRPTEYDWTVNTPEPRAIANQLMSGKLKQSILLSGTVGSGKTTWVKIYVKNLAKDFCCPVLETSGSTLTTKEISNRIDKRIIFCDEVQRLTKVQQDALLTPIESGEIILIGVTSESPYATLSKALCSRCTVLVMPKCKRNTYKSILRGTLERINVAVGIRLHINGLALNILVDRYGDDLRSALSILECLIVESINILDNFARLDLPYYIDRGPGLNSADVLFIPNDWTIDQRQLIASSQFNKWAITKHDEYDLISAYQKSMRGSDREAAIYYLARMIESGMDLKYIARRLVVTSTEDCDSILAFQTAVSAYQAVQIIGMPEGRLILAYATKVVCDAPKSIAAYTAYKNATELVKIMPDAAIPPAICNSGPKRGLYTKPSQIETLVPIESRILHNIPSYLPEVLRGSIIFLQLLFFQLDVSII